MPLHNLRIAVATLLMTALPALAPAQTTPAAPPANPGDTPAIRLGATVYSDYTFTQAPKVADSEGNLVHSNAFNVSRAYINVTGNISRVVNFRVTPDISRETGTGSTLSGSLVFRIKYTFLQFNLDDWMTAGSWARFGIQQTPWVEFEEVLYRYRFQGTVFADREGFLSSSDAGASFHYNLPSNYGDFHAGVYNGETYTELEANDRKAFQFRATVRPFAAGRVALRGLRAHAFYDADSHVKNGDRKRFLGSVTFEHARLNAGFDYLDASDQPSLSTAKKNANGVSIWATPRASNGWEGLFRVDRLEPDESTAVEAHRTRSIVGGAYWFPHQGTVSAALLLDFEQVSSKGFVTPAPTQKRIAVHALINF